MKIARNHNGYFYSLSLTISATDVTPDQITTNLGNYLKKGSWHSVIIFVLPGSRRGVLFFWSRFARFPEYVAPQILRGGSSSKLAKAVWFIPKTDSYLQEIPNYRKEKKKRRERKRRKFKNKSWTVNLFAFAGHPTTTNAQPPGYVERKTEKRNSELGAWIGGPYLHT